MAPADATPSEPESDQHDPEGRRPTPSGGAVAALGAEVDRLDPAMAILRYDRTRHVGVEAVGLKAGVKANESQP